MKGRIISNESQSEISLGRKIAFNVIGLLASVAVFFVAAEFVLRFLPYNEGLRTQPVNELNPVYHFQPNRTAIWSLDWDFKVVNEIRVNNEGFVNSNDYVVDAPGPLLAVIGDSFVEASIVPIDETMHSRLAQMVARPEGRVYSFAASGAGLAQYLIWAQYATKKFRPSAFVFSIVSNDFSDSLFHMQRFPGFHHFERLANGGLALRRIDYEPSSIRRILRRSALAMYLATNLKIARVFQIESWRIGTNDQEWVANFPRALPEENLADFRWAVDRFIEAIPEYTGLPYSKIVFTVDAIRRAMYDAEVLENAQTSVWAKMRRYVSKQARAKGITVVDLQPVFSESYRNDGQRFEFPTDSHWNSLGHALVAQAVSCTRVFLELFREFGENHCR